MNESDSCSIPFRMGALAVHCSHDVGFRASQKDRYSILGQAVEKLKEYESRIARVEQEKAALSAQLAQTTLTSGLGSAPTPPASASHPPLSTPLSNFQMIANMAVCYISLDGRILDANGCFISLFQFSAGHTAAAAAAASDSPDTLMSPTAPSSNGLTADIYTSSIFALTHHQELIHTLSILRNLLCGVMNSYECTKRCMDMKGKQIECAMTIASVMNAGKIVMFLCIFVPKSNGGGTANTAHTTTQSGSTPMSDVHAQQPHAQIHSQSHHPPHPQYHHPQAHHVMPQSHHPYQPPASMPGQQSHHISPTMMHRTIPMVPFSPTHRTYPRTPVATHAQHAYPQNTFHLSPMQPPLDHGSTGSVSSLAPLSSLSHAAHRPSQPISSSTSMELSDSHHHVSSMLSSPPPPAISMPFLTLTDPSATNLAPPEFPPSQTTGAGSSPPAIVHAMPPSDASAVTAANSFLDLTTPPVTQSALSESTSAPSSTVTPVFTVQPDPTLAASHLPDLTRPLSLLSDHAPPELTRATSMNSISGYQLSPMEASNPFSTEPTQTNEHNNNRPQVARH
jgi:hypothetical protein